MIRTRHGTLFLTLAGSETVHANVRFEKMKTLIQMFIAVMVIATLTGCASTKAYLVDRARDAADIFTVTVGTGVGVKARVGPIYAGLIYNHEYAGIAGGEIGAFNDRAEIVLPLPSPCPAASDGHSYMLANEFFMPKDFNFVERGRGKEYDAKSYIPFVMNKVKSDGFNPYFTQIEVSGGVMGTLKLGFNPGELLDFILGWSTIDIFRDDICIITPDKGLNKQQLAREEQREAEITLEERVQRRDERLRKKGPSNKPSDATR